MIVVDEYLAMDALAGRLAEAIPDGDLGLPSYRHWRLLQRVHHPGTGQLSRRLASLQAEDLSVLRFPHPQGHRGVGSTAAAG